MTKIGYIRASQLSTRPNVDEQALAVVDYGVSEKNIVSNLEDLRARLSKAGKKEVVVSSLDRLGDTAKEALALFAEIDDSGAVLTLLQEEVYEATSDSGSGRLVKRVLLSTEQMKAEQENARKKAFIEASRSRTVRSGPKPKLSSKDIEWIEEKREAGWGYGRIERALPLERNVKVSKHTILRAVGALSGATAYVPRDNHKYKKRDLFAEERGAGQMTITPVLKLGYVRVSTDGKEGKEQTLEQQIKTLIACGVPEENIFSEKISGSINLTQGEQWQALADRATATDGIVEIVAVDWSRISRNIKQCCLTAWELADEQGCVFTITRNSHYTLFAPNESMDILTFVIELTQAQMTREAISKATKEKLDFLKSQG